MPRHELATRVGFATVTIPPESGQAAARRATVEHVQPSPPLQSPSKIGVCTRREQRIESVTRSRQVSQRQVRRER